MSGAPPGGRGLRVPGQVGVGVRVLRRGVGRDGLNGLAKIVDQEQHAAVIKARISSHDDGRGVRAQTGRRS